LSTSIDLSQLASGVIEHFTGKLAEPEVVARALTQVFADIGQHTARMVGDDGYQALKLRALYLTRTDLKSDPTFSPIELTHLPEQSWSAAVEQLGEQVACRYAAALLGRLLGLLGTFIGEGLTVRLVRRTWAQIDVSAFTPTT
jgi:hypothetical protein